MDLVALRPVLISTVVMSYSPFTGAETEGAVMNYECIAKKLFILRCLHRTHPSTYKAAYTDACITQYTITVRKTVFLKMNPRVRNM